DLRRRDARPRAAGRGRRYPPPRADDNIARPDPMSATPSDLELLDAWRRGDGRSGELLFRRYFAQLNRFFRNKTDTGAEDLIQTTFLACVEGRDRFRESSSFRTYLFGIAHNVLCAHYRRVARTAD